MASFSTGITTRRSSAKYNTTTQKTQLAIRIRYGSTFANISLCVTTTAHVYINDIYKIGNI